jgi:MFS family permease
MIAASILAFTLFGVLLVLVGANQAVMARELGLDLAASGMLASSLALGAGLGITAAGPLYDRVRRGELFVASAAVTGVALCAITPRISAVGAGLCIAIAGLGAGAYNTVVNASIAERYGARAGRPLAITHASATLGAIGGPMLVAWVVSRYHWSWSFRLVGIGHLLLALGAITKRGDYPLPSTDGPSGRSRWPSIRGLAPFLVVSFAYVAVEGTATTFAVPYAVGHLHLDEARGQLAISALWLGVLVSRMGLILSPRSLGGRTLSLAGGLGAMAMIALVALQLRAVELAFGLVGAAVGLVYPLTMALIGQRFPQTRGTAAGLAGGAGASGAVIVPWLTGVIGDGYGVDRAVASLGLWCVVIGLAGIVIRRSVPDPAAIGSPRTDEGYTR